MNVKRTERCSVSRMMKTCDGVMDSVIYAPREVLGVHRCGPPGGKWVDRFKRKLVISFLFLDGSQTVTVTDMLYILSVNKIKIKQQTVVLLYDHHILTIDYVDQS